jgi:hypothetical protein
LSRLATPAAAGPLPVGGFTFTNGIAAIDAPHLAAVLAQDQHVPFSFAGAGGLITGNIVQTVTRSTVDNTLDFYWRISVDAGSAGGIASLAIDGFTLPADSPLWADYRSDSVGVVAPLSAERSFGAGEQIQFDLFALRPGQMTLALLLDTEATAYSLDGSMSLQAFDGPGTRSPWMPAFVPTQVPEPSTYGLFGLGLGALALATRRTNRRVGQRRR